MGTIILKANSFLHEVNTHLNGGSFCAFCVFSWLEEGWGSIGVFSVFCVFAVDM